MDASQTVEQDRQRLLAAERLILETVSFNFTSRMPFPYVIKMSRAVRGNNVGVSVADVAILTWLY